MSKGRMGNVAALIVAILLQSAVALAQPGTAKWNFATGAQIYSSPAIGEDGTVFVGSNDSKLYALNPDGSKQWEFTTGGGVSSPSIGFDGSIYVGSSDGKMYALNPDGSKRWEFTAGGAIYDSSPAIGEDGTIYVGS
jgi:outer membrane protein assembly factor BamB